MKLLDVLFGRTKPATSKLEKLFAISTACITLETKLELQPAGVAGIVFRPVEAATFKQANKELEQLLALSAQDSESQVHWSDDEFGFRWIIIDDEQFEDLVATLHMVSLTLAEHGFADQLLAAVFRFNGPQQAVYWIYNYKRGTFYPFVPVGERRRDNASELHLQAVMDKELPIDPALESWYALWGIPF